MVHGIAVSHVLNKLSVYASIATHREGDGQICLPGLVGDLEKLLLGELFGVGDDRNFVGEEIHQDLHPVETSTDALVHIHKVGVLLDVLVRCEAPYFIALSMMVKLEAGMVVEYWRVIFLLRAVSLLLYFFDYLEDAPIIFNPGEVAPVP